MMAAQTVTVVDSEASSPQPQDDVRPVSYLSLKSIPEHSEHIPLESRVPTLPHQSSAVHSSQKTFVRGHRSQRSYSPTRFSFASRGFSYKDGSSPTFEPVVSMATSKPSTSSGRVADYYDDQFRYKAGQTSLSKDRVLQLSPVIVHLRTNVRIKDEHTIITDLSNQISTRYARPESCVTIDLDHSACLAIGGTFDPAYRLTVSACPSFVQPTLNMRNAALLQEFIHEVLGVPADRGIVVFKALPEESIATSGRTVLADIEEQQGGRRRSTDAASISSTRPSIFRGLHKGKTRSRHALNMRSQQSMSSMTSMQTSRSSGEQPTLESPVPEVPALPAHLTAPDNNAGAYADSGIGTPTDGKMSIPSPNKSAGPETFSHMMTTTSVTASSSEPPRMSKRKSLMQMIRKSRSKPVAVA